MLATSHEVTNYRAAETGLVSAHLTNGKFLCIFRKYSGLHVTNQAPPFHEVQHRVSALIRDKIIVGHNLWQFLSASTGTLSS
jgi:hypothetical protein